MLPEIRNQEHLFSIPKFAVSSDDVKNFTESPPAERVGSGGPPEGGDDVGKAPVGLFTCHQILTPTVLVHFFLALECMCVWFLHPNQLY